MDDSMHIFSIYLLPSIPPKNDNVYAVVNTIKVQTYDNATQLTYTLQHSSLPRHTKLTRELTQRYESRGLYVDIKG
jgi:hypothetical protein